MFDMPIRKTASADGVGFHIEEQIADLSENMDKIRPSSLIFDREGSIAYADRAREVLGDILPVRMSTMLVASCDIRGATEFCTDIYEDPDYAAQLLSFVTDAMIAKIKAWRRYLGLSERADAFFFADDSIALLSSAMYEELVLPMHQKLVRALTAEGAKISIHLCGDATRHFKTLMDGLGVTSFDTGFPVAHGELVSQLGPGIVIQGGPHVELLRTGAAEAVTAETKRILLEVRDKTRRFILRDANNVAPGTPLENLRAMYSACREWGRLDGKNA